VQRQPQSVTGSEGSGRAWCAEWRGEQGTGWASTLPAWRQLTTAIASRNS
jgi:hypothetical protein